jgi:far upstream element-binding protein
MLMQACIQVGLIIGRGGETIKGLQAKSGARIQVFDIAGLAPRCTFI